MISPTDPAFPSSSSNATFAWNGMDTRTYLAGLAMQGLIVSHDSYNSEHAARLARRAVQLADSLIEALNKPVT